ncbi:MAG: hypothetical protein RJB39_777 [Candidatus Parcubacteria bacterium]|jgi:glycosyltransferase involved in cell wall biosynthesis
MKLLMITQKVDMNDSVMGFCHAWVKKIAAQVDTLYVITLYQGVTDLPKNVKLFSLKKEKGYPRFLRYILFYIHLFRVMWRVDGVFLHMCPEYFQAIYPLNFFLRKKVTLWYAHVKMSPLAAWVGARVNTVLSPSKESFLAEGKNFVSTGHGVDVEVFKPDPGFVSAPVKNLVHIGRISKIKDIDVIIKAINHVVNVLDVTNFTLNIYGAPARVEDDAYLAELKQMVTDFHLEKYIIWHGELRNTDATLVYQKADMFIRSMAKGGYGKVDLEALATAVPTVLSTPVYKEYFGDLYDDMYFLSGDYTKLAENIVTVLNWDEGRLARFKKIARDLVVENHNLDKLAVKIVNSFMI